MLRFVNTAPYILGVVWPSFRPRSGSKSKISGQIPKGCLGPSIYLQLSSHFTFEFWLGPGTNHEMALELVYGANFMCVLHHFSSLTCLKGFWGQLWPKTDPTQQQNITKMIISPRGLTASTPGESARGRVRVGQLQEVFGRTSPGRWGVLPSGCSPAEVDRPVCLGLF